MLEADYTPRPARVHTTQASAKLAPRGESRRLRLGVGADEAGDELLDLSTKGLKLRTRTAGPALGETLEIALRHPHLRGPIRVQGQVKWSRPGGEGARLIGVEFEHLRDTTKVAIMQLVVLELGSTAYGAAGPVGFVAEVRPEEGEARRFVLYDRTRLELARISKRATGFTLETETETHPEVATLKEALALGFAQPSIRVVPPLR